MFDGGVAAEEFKERSWHWWLSRVLIPLTVAVVALAGALWVNRDQELDRVGNEATPTTPSYGDCAATSSSLDSGWGPDRPTIAQTEFTQQPSFNVERQNPNYGDERNFTSIKEVSFSEAGGWEDTLKVAPGQEYLLRIYVHNGARESPENVARDTRVHVGIPSCTGKFIAIQGSVRSPSAYPQVIWDTVILEGDSPLRVELVPGSALLMANDEPEGVELPDRISTGSGALIGSSTADGNFGAGYANSAIVTVRVRTFAA